VHGKKGIFPFKIKNNLAKVYKGRNKSPPRQREELPRPMPSELESPYSARESLVSSFQPRHVILTEQEEAEMKDFIEDRIKRLVAPGMEFLYTTLYLK
jgi:hypothetical protein